MSLRSLFAAIIMASLMVLVGCGTVRTVSYTYTKANITQQVLLDDENRLKNTPGVQQVIPKFDDKKTGRIEIILDQENKMPGLRLLQDLGYQQVVN